MNKLIVLFFVFLFSFKAMAVATVLDLTGATTSQTSVGTSVPGTVFSIQCDVSGATFDVDVKAQASLDGTVWTDLSGLTVNLTSANNVLFDITGGSHLEARVVVTRNSGTYNITCKVKN